MAGYGINSRLTKKFGIIIGPDTIYSKLVSLERKGWTKYVRAGVGRSYSLTEKGREITDNIESITEETRSFVRILLSC